MKNIPSHIAIIMDGNGRWAKNKGFSRSVGHKKGAETLEKIIETCMNLNINTLSVYAFSTENWKRPKLEINAIFKLFSNYLKEKKQELFDKNIRLVVSGTETNLSENLKKEIQNTCDFLKSREKFTLNICFNYGGRQEIIDAVNKIIKDDLKEVDENIFNNYLYNNISFPDLVIRTGGDFRISNFLLYQIAYSELYFTDCLWPDFDENELMKALSSYQNRDRRYGGLNVK